MRKNNCNERVECEETTVVNNEVEVKEDKHFDLRDWFTYDRMIKIFRVTIRLFESAMVVIVGKLFGLGDYAWELGMGVFVILSNIWTAYDWIMDKLRYSCDRYW